MDTVNLPADEDPKDHPRYEEILNAISEGRVEVSCPWWSKNHWESKTSGNLVDGCSYRIHQNPLDR